MNLRIVLSFIIVLAWVSVGAVFIFKSDTGADTGVPDLPFFYTLAPDDIRAIGVSTDLGTTEFTLRPEERIWYFSDRPTIPVSHDRFGGMIFLLGGPKVQRILTEEVSDDSLFGLRDPGLVVDLTLRDGSVVAMELGNLTPDGNGQYARMVGFPQLALVDSSWGSVISRLVDEPPNPDWLYTMQPSSVTEVLFFEGNDVIRGIAFHDDLGWVECDIPLQNDVPCAGTTPIDYDGLEPWLEHMAAPEFLGVAQIARTADQATPELFGITPESPYLDIRIENEQRTGVTEVTHVTLAIGDENPDGRGIYVRAMEEPDISEVTLEWGRQVLKFFDDKSFVDQ
ncbi:MAG: DUF4340 domain-containing protein [Chloroflexi bacterium]|nr:DUF4340 domain-containing protein [Chloroflexota bacterium]